MLRLKLHRQILIALLLAVMVGSLAGAETRLLGVPLISILEFVGALFMNALKMLIVPLIVSSIITGIAGMGRSRDFGRLGVKTLFYYCTTSLLAILVGLALVNAIEPGYGSDGTPVKEQIGLSSDAAAEINETLAGRGAADVVEVFLRMIPPNIVAAAAEGQMLGLISFCLLFGYFMSRIGEPYAEYVHGFWKGIFEISTPRAPRPTRRARCTATRRSPRARAASWSASSSARTTAIRWCFRSRTSAASGCSSCS